jgi:shikimate kinase
LYTQSKNHSSFFFLIGLMGVGKSHYAKSIASDLSISYIDLDQFIEQQESCSIQQIFMAKGEEYFRKIETIALQQIINTYTHKTIVACGGGAPCFNNNIEKMNEAGTTIWLNEDLHICAKRLAHLSATKPLILYQSEQEILNTLSDLYKARKSYYTLATFQLPSHEISLEKIKKIIQKDG